MILALRCLANRWQTATPSRSPAIPKISRHMEKKASLLNVFRTRCLCLGVDPSLFDVVRRGGRTKRRISAVSNGRSSLMDVLVVAVLGLFQTYFSFIFTGDHTAGRRILGVGSPCSRNRPPASSQDCVYACA
mmetsp:Transcript_8923/g.21955  ORF Transcript_8923/g.21955 Transcript_8923/m.21955 type:complete len:132 (+) Transcript_8923:1102-1497(+)